VFTATTHLEMLEESGVEIGSEKFQGIKEMTGKRVDDLAVSLLDCTVL